MEAPPLNETNKAGAPPPPCRTDPLIAKAFGVLVAFVVGMAIYISSMHARQMKTQQRIFDAFIEMSKVRGIDRQNLDTTLPKINKLIGK